MMKNVPETIFLNLGSFTDEEWADVKDADFDEHMKNWEITWCADKIDTHDIEYVRKDIALGADKWHYYKEEPPKTVVTAVVLYPTCYKVMTSFKVADGTFRFDNDDDDQPIAWMKFPYPIEMRKRYEKETDNE